LEVGCGTGRFTSLMATMGATAAFVDTSPGMIERTRTRVPAATGLLADALGLPFEDKAFDIGLSVWVYNHLSRYEDAVAELCRVTRRRVVLGLPNLHSLFLLPQLIRSLHISPIRYTVRTYKHVNAPASYYFRLGDLRRLLEKNGFRVTSASTSTFMPVVPSPLAGIYPSMERALRKALPGNGCFLAIAATRAD
jgi:ubiquinone/menaquinone biosynthesis C-methylase UbiE